MGGAAVAERLERVARNWKRLLHKFDSSPLPRNFNEDRIFGGEGRQRIGEPHRPGGKSQPQIQGNKITHSAESSRKRELRWGVEELNVIVIRVSEREFGTLIRNIYTAVINRCSVPPPVTSPTPRRGSPAEEWA